MLTFIIFLSEFENIMLRELKTPIACLFCLYLYAVKLVSEHWCPDAFHAPLPGCPSCTKRLPGSPLWITVNQVLKLRFK